MGNREHIKELKLKSGDCFKIKDTCVGKINDKKVFKVSIHKDQEELCAAFYLEEERKTLRLDIGSKIQLEVNTKDTPQDTVQILDVTKDDQPSLQLTTLEKALEFSSEVSQTPSFLSQNRFDTSILSVLLEDAKLWIKILALYQREK